MAGTVRFAVRFSLMADAQLLPARWLAHPMTVERLAEIVGRLYLVQAIPAARTADSNCGRANQ